MILARPHTNEHSGVSCSACRLLPVLSGVDEKNDPLSHTNSHEDFVRDVSCYFVDRSCVRAATSFGLLQFANDAEIRMQTAGKKYLSSQETVFPRDEIRKIWRASLRFEERNTGKGALIGAGIGSDHGSGRLPKHATS